MMKYGKYVNILNNYLKKGPHHAQWFLTRKCNYRCMSCNVWSDQNREELSTEEIKSGLDTLNDLGVVEITFSGGNPLLREDIGEIMEYSSRYFITTIYDNGSMAKNKIDALRHADSVALSLDTMDRKKQDYIKGVKGSFENFLESMEALRENKIKFFISPTISEENIEDVGQMIDYFGSRGIMSNICLYSFDSIGSRLFAIGKENDEMKIKSSEKLIQTFDELMKHEKNLIMPKKVLQLYKTYLQTNERWSCRAFDNFIFINNLGEVSGCHVKNPVTTIFDLKEFWSSEEAKKIRDENSHCKKCDYICYPAYSISEVHYVKPILRAIF